MPEQNDQPCPESCGCGLPCVKTTPHEIHGCDVHYPETPTAKPGPSPRYHPTTTGQALGHLVEECGEVLSAVGKSQRWGLDSSNPELPEDERETNRDWLLRELVDLERAIAVARHAVIHGGPPAPGVDLRPTNADYEMLRLTASMLDLLPFKIILGDDGEVTLRDVFSGVGIDTDQGLFGIAQRDGGIEVMLNGELVWSSTDPPKNLGDAAESIMDATGADAVLIGRRKEDPDAD